LGLAGRARGDDTARHEDPPSLEDVLDELDLETEILEDEILSEDEEATATDEVVAVANGISDVIDRDARPRAGLVKSPWSSTRSAIDVSIAWRQLRDGERRRGELWILATWSR
jgi:hypothetical protein